jgi:hypothetical protein
VIKKILFGLGVVLLIAVAIVYVTGLGLFGDHEGPGVVSAVARPAGVVGSETARTENAAAAIGVARAKQIVFGDLHVHTTFSFDAFLTSLPMSQGEGAHPPADACDFARQCSALDFWSINDHAEQITPANWQETIDSIRQCNAVAGDPTSPDTVAYLGWEWTDVGDTPEDHFGHKNVVLAHTDDDRIPARPIAASSTVRRTEAIAGIPTLVAGAIALSGGDSRYHDLARYLAERRRLEDCPEGVDVHDLPTDCRESAATPADLFRKLDEWGHDALVIPHGTTWGFYTPPGSTWAKQLAGDLHDPDRQTLFEIYSGHGNSDEYSDFREIVFEDGGVSCPAPTPGYLPTCWRAGEIIEARCLAAGETGEICSERAREARHNAALAFSQDHLTVPGAQPADWLDAGQCRECAQPAFNYRPGGSAQYVLALGNFDDPANPKHFRFGFMGSSDNHFGRPGTGFKEVHRLGFTESRPRGQGGVGAGLLTPRPVEPIAQSKTFDRNDPDTTGFALMQLERQGSFFMTGGLIAAHATGRDRESVWQALERREVYGTSGPRILLWFDLINPPGTSGLPIPMGGEVEMAGAPIFQVRAVGSYEQLPGCPDYVVSSLGAERTAYVCKNECYNPSDRRRLISRIEIVRIRPQISADEPIAPLIEDPWRSIRCQPDPSGCAISFSDPEYETDGRNTVYYVRAIETPAPGINAGGVRCEYDDSGKCVDVDLCSGGIEDECLAPQEPKAWSSPIYVDRPSGTKSS